MEHVETIEGQSGGTAALVSYKSRSTGKVRWFALGYNESRDVYVTSVPGGGSRYEGASLREVGRYALAHSEDVRSYARKADAVRAIKRSW